MQKDYRYIFLGASCFALACASQRPDECLILEQGEGLGAEFCDALFSGPVISPVGEGAAFYRECIRRKIMTEESAARGEIHLPAVHMVLNRMALDTGIRILFRTQVIQTEKVEDTIRIQAVCNARILQFACDRIIDTRSGDFAWIRERDPQAHFFLGANLYAPDIPADRIGPCPVRKGFLPGEAFLHMPVRENAVSDRGRLMRIFENRAPCWRRAKLLLVSGTYAVQCLPIRAAEDGCIRIPGAGFGNPFQAWDAGLHETEVFGA